ncbi:MAG: helix-turn-helix domain-containing protein [Deltaproteobacteria bacterium]|nr:helix-turn-helix domain-containing protein [Deltaproteobacteria bacterium]
MATKELTITEAARRLGVSRQAIHEAVSKGLLKARKGKVTSIVWLISEDSLNDYKASPRSKAQRRRKR